MTEYFLLSDLDYALVDFNNVQKFQGSVNIFTRVRPRIDEQTNRHMHFSTMLENVTNESINIKIYLYVCY